MYMTDGENGQRGIALFMSLIVLLLLSVLAIALVYMATTDTTVNANYRNQQVLYFAAKAGIEEARDRLMSANPNTVLAPTCTPSASCLPAVPAPPTIGKWADSLYPGRHESRRGNTLESRQHLRR
jgi:Tfp pilus assembly protein PilX